jgi:tRNA dimethylallyltransferase
LEKIKNKFLIVICGPTAVGKTKVAIRIAKTFNSEIISADSRQIYRELKIGVASPTPDELKAVRHHFVGCISVGDYYNISKFEEEVIQWLENWFKSHQYAVMTGGSGLYIDSVCKGIDELPDPDNFLRKELTEKLKKEGIDSLKMQLKQLDPGYYATVDLNNPSRILRALEVCIITGKPYSSFRTEKSKPRKFKIVKIGLNLPRHELINQIDKRVDQMITNGLVEEVKSLLPFRNLNSLNTVGYKEIFKYLDGDLTLNLAVEKIKTNTRRYAKRQLTWFKKDKNIYWFHPEEVEKIESFISSKK